MKELVDAFVAAVAANRAEGIKGWGLRNPDPNVFSLVEVGAPTGCTTSTCNHFSHDPAATVNKLLPRDGWTVHVLADSQHAEEIWVTYYVTRKNEEARIWCLREETQYWAELWEVQADKLPAWALTNLVAEAEHD